MLKTRFVYGTDAPDLNESLNKALDEVTSEKVNIHYDFDHLIAVIEYEFEELYKKEICCDCQFWDDSQSSNNLYGLCHYCGGRKRFSDKACPNYKDNRS